jgi:hypothetical protein
MRDNITLEHQIDDLTSQCRKLVTRNAELEERLGYVEMVVAKLLVALREGGVIVPAGSMPDSPEYEF